MFKESMKYMSTFEEIKESCKNNLNEKLSTPFYGTFIVSWILWNWKVWYVTFFIDAALLIEKQNILKIDYIHNLYKWSSFLDFICSLSHLIAFPLVSTWVIIYIMPRITCKFYEKYLETENKNKLAKNKKDKQFLEVAEDKLDVEKNVVMKQAEIKEKKREIESEKTQEEKWNDEYNIFKNNKHYNTFELIKRYIYENNGWGNDLQFNIRAYFDSNGIIKNSDEDANRIELTDKGRYFMKKYTEEN